MISIDWATKIIYIPQSDLTPLSGANYRLDADWFRLQLKDLEDSEEGAVWPDTHRHATASTLSGVTYARQLEILAPYTITFQDTGSPYTVNVVGANHNIADVKNVNQVSLIVGNSAGLISVSSGANSFSLEDVRLAALNAGTNGYSRPTGTIQAGSNTITSFCTNRTDSVTDIWKDCLLLFTSGALKDQVKKVLAYNATTHYLTVQGGYTTAPSIGDAFILLNY